MVREPALSVNKHVPVYPIRTLIRLAGVKRDLIYASEKRGLIKPARTEGGRRLYAEEDVERIRWIKAMRESGASLESVWQAVQGCRDGRTELPRCPSNAEGSE